MANDSLVLIPAGPMTVGQVDALERAFLKHEQVDCPVIYRFGPNICIREVTVPADTWAVGHHQKQEHLNYFLRGRVTVINEDGSHTELVAPMMFIGPPGRKIGYVHETMVWQNIYANPTNETNIDKLEAMFLDKSEGWQARPRPAPESHAADVADYHGVLAEFGFTAELARAQSEAENDQIPFPLGNYKVMVAASPIEGKGLFAIGPFEAGEMIAPARIDGLRTPAGRYTNHSVAPNAHMIQLPSGNIVLAALRTIRGCAGGELGEEITICYRAALGLQIQPKGKRPCPELQQQS